MKTIFSAAEMIWLDSACYPDFQTSAVSAFADQSGVNPCMAVFRRTFQLENTQGLLLRFSGSGKCRIFLNGQFVDDGPCELGGDWGKTQAPDWRFFSEIDISPFCRTGQNILAAEVLNVCEAQTDYSSGLPGFICEIVRDGHSVVSTDCSWKGFRNPGYEAPDRYDENKAVQGYLLPDFDDSAYPDAVKSRALPLPYTDLELAPLSRRKVRPCRTHLICPDFQQNIVVDEDYNIAVNPGPPVSVLLEFPEEVCGHLSFETESDGRAEIIFEMMENPASAHERFSYTAAEGHHSFTMMRMQVCQFLRISFFTGNFNSPDYGRVILRNLVFRTCGYPVGKTVKFECSDPELTEIRDCCDRTLRMCKQRLHLDSPVHQEGLGCEADYRIESLMGYSLYGETALVRADLIRAALHIRQTQGRIFHTSFALIYISWLYEYVLYTGDLSLAKKLFPEVRTILLRFAEYTGKEGLVSQAPNYLFIDWVVDGSQNYHHPPAERGMGSMTAFCIKALDDAAKLADFICEDSKEYRRRSSEMRKAFQQLWDPEREAYCDGIPFLSKVPAGGFMPADEGVRSFSVQTNALAVAYGFVPEERADSLLETVLFDRMLIPCQMYFMHYVFEAIHARNKFDEYGMDQLKRWLVPVREHPSTLKESWNAGDYSHAWGGTPVWQIIRGIMGVEILEPGCRKVRIAPHPCGMDFSGEFPVPSGIIRVSNKNGREEISLPSGMIRVK